jgi:hypothetical protein
MSLSERVAAVVFLAVVLVAGTGYFLASTSNRRRR